MKKILFYTLLFFAANANSQISFGVGVHPEPNYKKMLKKAKTNLLLENKTQVQLKVDFWKDNMPTTDKQPKDYIQFNVSVFASAGTVNASPKKLYFLYYTGKSEKPTQAITFSYDNNTWIADDAKTKLQTAPAKVVVEFEETQSKKTHLLKNEGPFRVEEVH